MKKLAIVTATRAEYGLLSPVIRELRKYEDDSYSAEVIVTGTHLHEEFGNTIDEISRDNIRVDHIVKVPIKTDTPLDIAENQSKVLLKFTDLLMKEKYDGILILGDRYEMISVAIAALNTHTPIFHMCGGDISEGAIDDSIRHSITKMSSIHFPTNEQSRKRIIQMGEAPERVFNFGSTSVDNILKLADMSKTEALNSVGLDECTYAICTYHPATLGHKPVSYLMDELVDVFRNFPDIHFIITKSNADQGGREINDYLDSVASSYENLHVFASLGSHRYLSLMKYAEFVIGNSSSGIIEAPVFRVPTVNIGDRQKGRLRVASIIDCEDDSSSITTGIRLAMSDEFRDKCAAISNPYGDGKAAVRIAEKIIEIIGTKSDLSKHFYELVFED